MFNNLFRAPVKNLIPKFVSNQKRLFSAEAVHENLTLTFAAPHTTILKQQAVESITVPGQSGMFALLKQHVPRIAELKPGVVTVKFLDGKEDSYFISGGFAFMHKDNSCQVNVVEVFKLDELDPAAAKEGFAKWSAEYGKATSEADKVKAQIALEVFEAMSAAVGGK